MKRIEVSSELADYFVPLTAVCFEKDIELLCMEDFFGMLSIGTNSRLYLYYGDYGKAARFQKADITGSLGGNVKRMAAMQAENGKEFIISVIAGEELYYAVTDTPQKPAWRRVDFSEAASGRAYIPEDVCISAFSDQIILAAELKDKGTGKTEQFFVESDLAGSSLKYYPCAANFETIKASLLGQAVSQRVPGIYTYGNYAGTEQILYTPVRNVYQPGIMPSPFRLAADRGTDAISLVPLSEDDRDYPGTHLFAGGGGKLFFYPFRNQVDCIRHPEKGPTLIARSDSFNQIKKMESYCDGTKLYVWILNESGELLYLCADTEKGLPVSFSGPLLFRENVLHFGAKPGKIFLCESSKGMKLTIGEYNRNSGVWDFSSVLIDGGLSKKMEPVKIPAYMTKAIVYRENGAISEGTKVCVTALDNAEVYINGIYRKFEKGKTLTFRTNEQGCVNIVQAAKTSLMAVSYEISLAENKADGIICEDPSRKAREKLMGLDTPEKIKAAQIVDIHGNARPFITGVSESDLEHTAAIVGKLNTVQNMLAAPCDMNGMFACREADSFITDFFDAVEDAFNYVKGKQIKGFDIFIDAVTKTWNFVIKIGEKIIGFVIDTAEQIYSCIVKVFEYIKAGIEKVIDWLKFVFNMDDVVRLKNTMKQFVKLSLKAAADKLEYARGIADQEIQGTIEKITEWGGIDEPKIEPAGEKEGYQPDSGNMYLFDLIFGNLQPKFEIPAMEISGEAKKAVARVSGLYAEMQTEMKGYAGNMLDTVTDALEHIDFSDVNTIMAALKKTAAVLAVTGLEIVRKVVDALFELLETVISSIFEYLDAPVYLPFISEVLELFGIDEFSVLDIVTIVPAFLTSVIFKIIKGKPVVDETVYTQIMDARKIEELNFGDDAADALGDLPAGGKKTGVQICKICLFGVSLTETILTGVLYATVGTETPPLYTKISTCLGAADFAFSMISGYVCYSPMTEAADDLDTAISIYTYAWIGKSMTFLLGGILQILEEMTVEEKLKTGLKKAANVCNIIAGGISLVGLAAEITACVMAARVLADTHDKKIDKAIFLTEDVGYMVDDVRNIMDVCTVFFKEEEPVNAPVPPWFTVIRTIGSGGYCLSQLASLIILSEG